MGRPRTESVRKVVSTAAIDGRTRGADIASLLELTGTEAELAEQGERLLEISKFGVWMMLFGGPSGNSAEATLRELSYACERFMFVAKLDADVDADRARTNCFQLAYLLRNMIANYLQNPSDAKAAFYLFKAGALYQELFELMNDTDADRGRKQWLDNQKRAKKALPSSEELARVQREILDNPQNGKATNRWKLAMKETGIGEKKLRKLGLKAPRN